MRLIDADNLQDTFIEECAGECSVCIYNKRLDNEEGCALIDNEPTVNPTQKVVVVPSEVIKKVADCVVNTINNIDWSRAIDAYKEIYNEKPDV